ncbi:MAG: ZIP family metal transporter [Gaiellaceae bacterium]
MTVLSVFAAAALTAAATGLGALPFLFVRRPGRSWLGMANGLASGFMVGASIGLLWEGSDYGLGRVVAGAAAGAFFLVATRRQLGRGREPHFGAFRGAAAASMLLIVGVMTAHSFTEGVGVGVAFGGGDTLGLVIALAIAIHNVPEGLAISLVLVPRGVSVARAAAWSVFSSLPQPLMAVPAFVFVETFEPVLPFGLGFAAGAMLGMVAAELLPEALDAAPARWVGAVGLSSVAAMVALQLALLR